MPHRSSSWQRNVGRLGAQAIFVRADVTKETEVERLIATTLTHFGRLDVAVNNAGIEGMLGPITDQTEQNYMDTFKTNVWGTLLSMKYEMPPMLRQGGGSIINLSSVAGQVGFAGASVYAASKHAVEGLTKSAALEVAAHGVRVNAVAPGPIETDMLDRFVGRDQQMKAELVSAIPAKRVGRPEEIAETIVFLASQQAPFLTGQVITVDGAYTSQ